MFIMKHFMHHDCIIVLSYALPNCLRIMAKSYHRSYIELKFQDKLNQESTCFTSLLGEIVFPKATPRTVRYHAKAKDHVKWELGKPHSKGKG